MHACTHTQQERGDACRDVDGELQDLRAGEVPLPPHGVAERGERVVAVHGHVHCQVEGDGQPLAGGVILQLRPAEHQRRGVVEDVQERRRAAAQHQEQRVQQLLRMMRRAQ